jgi:hypothetical protein
MSQLSISTLDTREARRLILEMRGGSLTDNEAFNLNACTHGAVHTRICTIDDQPVAAWGLVPPSLLGDHAYLWLHCTPRIDEYKFMFIRRSQIEIQYLRSLYPTIHGVCEIGNTRAIRWIKWLGGRFGDHVGNHIPFVIETPNG